MNCGRRQRRSKREDVEPGNSGQGSVSQARILAEPIRFNQIEATVIACAMSHDFRIERVTRLVKHIVSVQEVSEDVSLAASQLDYMQLKLVQKGNERICMR